MYYQSYEDYIRSILGYPVQTTNNMYQNSTYNSPNESYGYMQNSLPRYSNEILDLYPEIYKIVNPMVCKICEANSKPITRELLEQMTDEIYLNIEGNTNLEEDTTINVRVNLPNSKDKQGEEVKQKLPSLNSSKQVKTTSSSKQTRQEEITSLSTEKRQTRRNNTLRDLIKILILNQLLGGGRPPKRPGMPRPPYPGGPRPNPRPPINPRDGYNII